MNNKVYILVDRSGSMGNMWDETISGINSYVKEIEEADVMLAVFDNAGYDVIRNCNKKDWDPVSTKEVLPRGSTPLLDASGRILWNMIDSKAKRAILVIVTDGFENASSKFNKNEIETLTKYVTEKLDYEIVFLGANFDKIGDVADSLNLKDSSRYMATSRLGFNSAALATAGGTRSYLSNGRSKLFYSETDKLSAKS